MAIDLSFVESIVHRHLIEEALEQAHRDDEVIGTMLLGSVARGDASPGSDLDLYMILRDGCSRSFHSEIRQGIVVEYKYRDFDLASSKLEEDPMNVYDHLDGRILYDSDGRLERLAKIAKSRFETYRVPGQERQALSYWLKSARSKIRAARDRGDFLKAAYVVSTNSWEILKGMWAANERPMPPQGAVWAHIKDLSRAPPNVGTWLQQLFGGDTITRIRTAVEIIDWVVPFLENDEV